MEYNLHSSLTRKKIRDLVNIACRLNIVDDDEERNAKEWVRVIEEQIGEHAYDVKECIGIDCVQWLSRRMTAARLKGGLYVFEDESRPFGVQTGLLCLADLGLAVKRNNGTIGILKEAKPLLKCTTEEAEKLRNAAAAASTLYGFLSLYGAVPLPFAVNWLAHVPDADDRIRKAMLSLYLHRWGLEGLMTVRDEYWMIWPDMQHREELLPVLMRELPEELRRKSFTEPELEKAYCGMYGDELLFSRLTELLKQSGCPEDKVTIILRELYIRQQAAPQDAARELLACIPERERVWVRRALLPYMETLPRWRLFGYSSKETQTEEDVQTDENSPRRFSDEPIGRLQ